MSSIDRTSYTATQPQQEGIRSPRSSSREAACGSAIDLVADARSREPFPAELLVGARVLDDLRQRRVLARSMGDTMIIGPSLVASANDVDEMVDAHERSIVAVTAGLAGD